MTFSERQYYELRKKRLEELKKQAEEKKANADIGPVRTDGLDFFQKGTFDDGYQIGDVTKAILGTTADVGVGVIKGVSKMAGGIVDAGMYGAAGVADLVGADDFADRLRVKAQENTIDDAFRDYDEVLNQYSLLGRSSDAVAEGLGQVGALILTGGAAGLGTAGTTALTTGAMGLSSFGSGMSEAYAGGATDKEAATYGLISGIVNAGSELIFGGLGKTVKALGFSKGLSSLDDVFARKLSSKIANQTAKNFVEYGVKASAEGIEEVLAGIGEAVGKKLTYMSEEELAKLVEDENLLEQFVVGAVTSGISQSGIVPGMKGGSLKEANQTGRDFITGLTENDQKVVDRLVADLVEEESKDKELSKKDKDKLYDRVMESLERGEVSLDTIAEVIDSEGYKAYKDMVAEEENAVKELGELYKGEELEKELADFMANTESQNVRNELDKKVYEQVKGGKLEESYLERGRRGQKYEADVSRYDEKQRATIQNAINSGILNNTRRTHEFVDLIAKITADKGVSFDFINNEKLKGTSFAVGDGKTVNGFVTADGVTLNIDSAKALNKVVGHEITHVLEGTELYAELKEALESYAKSRKAADSNFENEYLERYYNTRELYRGVDGYKGLKGEEKIKNEVIADLVGDYLFTDADFVNSLSANKNLFQKIYDEIKYLCKVATAGSKEARELEKIKRIFEQAYGQKNTANDGGTKYSITEPFTDAAGTYFENAVLLDTDFFDGLSPRKWGEKLRTFVNERANTNPFILPVVDENGNTALLQFAKPNERVRKDGHTEHKVLDELTTTSDNISKLAVVHIDEIVSVSEENSPYYTEENRHGWLDKNGWLHRNANVINQKNGNIYNLTFDIAKAADGRTILYATDGKIKKVGSAEVNSLKIKGSGQNSNSGESLPQGNKNVKRDYSLSDSDGRELSPAVQKRFGNSKVVDENGSLKVVYHGTATGEFSIFDKAKGSVEGDFGSGFYFTDNESDVSEHYEGGGPDFDNKVARLAEQIEAEEEIDYDEAEERAREQLYKGSHKFEVYLNIENPAIVGKTMLLDNESYMEQYNEEDYDDYDDYLADVEQLVADDIDNIVWEVERNIDVNDTDGISGVLWEAYSEGGIGLEELKAKLNDLYLEDSNGNLVANEVARQIVESLGYDGIINPTVSGKWNMNIEDGTTHYIVFKPNQIKAVTNQNPTDNPDIHLSLSRTGEQYAPSPNDVYGKDIALSEDIGPVRETVAENATVAASAPDESAPPTEKAAPATRKELHAGILDGIKAKFKSIDLDFDDVLKQAKNLSTFSTVDNTPQRVMEKALGYKEGQALADETVNKVAQNETEGIKWLNSFTDRKNGILAQISKQYNIKPGSKESAAAQMYAEGFYVDDNNDIIEYGDAELAKDFPDAKVQANIKGLAKDQRIRQIYDETLSAINESRTRNAYPEIPRLDNYFLHFRAMDDTFSRLGLPFNPNDIRAKDLPTDLNGVTADLKPGQPYFASAKHRLGKRTSFDLLGGLERYLSSAKNQIYHIDDIQTLRALRNYIADTYGQANGLEGLDALSEEEAQERIEQVFGSHLSTFAKFLNEEANILAGKTSLIDRGLEGVIGRRGMTFLDNVNKQVGSNMVGYNISSSLTNFLPVAQALAKSDKGAFVKAFAQTVSGKISRRSDGFAEASPVMIRRKGADRFYRTLWQKMADPGYALIGAVDDISTELIARTKFNELVSKGMDEQKAHLETDKWVSRLMGDRSLGQQPQLYNSKMLGLITKFQLEVRNQLDSQFYDTIQEAKVSNEQIQNEVERNARTAAKVASTFAQLAFVQHLFGAAFEAVAGYNPAFDIIEVLMTTLGFDDDEDSEDTALDNIEQGFIAMLEDLPYTSTFTGGRIPISNALPIKELVTGTDEWGNDKSRLKALVEIAPYMMPGGYGQAKKTVQGLRMFNDDLPIAGSYTDSGKLRFTVDDTLGSRIQAGVFGQYASENARNYFDNERAPLTKKQTQELVDVDIPIVDYWKYRDGLSGMTKLDEKADYIASLDLPIAKKNILVNNQTDRKEPIDLTDYDKYGSFAALDYAQKNYGRYVLSKAVAPDLEQFKKISGALSDIKSDKDSNGQTISGSRKEKVVEYINGLNLDYGQKIILFKSEYNADNTHNYDIIDYLNSRNDLSCEEMETILKELGFTVSSDGTISW